MTESVVPEDLHFDVSSGLKNVLGSELITNDEVAIFELVKNSFDAGAASVLLHFSDEGIVVADNGHGMSYSDITQKWLFVAYSSKRESKNGFRDEIADRKHFAGSKGIGRFSSDRLGQLIKLQTRSKEEVTGPVHSVTVDWGRFDSNHLERFETIPVDYRIQGSEFQLPEKVKRLKHGTVVSILQPRKKWDRETILRLKSALAKLINPFGADSDGFRIIVNAPNEQVADDAIEKAATKRGEELSPNALVNGQVGNFIFSTLQEKTTFIHVVIDASGKFIESNLTDRGELIYRVREPNEYNLLANSGFECKVFFLNQSAKLTFAKRMGIPSVQFGSVFLFRNGFRVFPIGEEGDDWFGMDRRKQQGYARFLGTRDVIGRIDVSGADRDFQEASSRNTGLIKTAAVAQLHRCFQEHCLKRLERYIVPVTFVDKEDKNTSDVSRLLTDPGRARVAAAVAKLVDDRDVELLEYSKRLIGILDERSSQFEGSLTSLRAIAEKTADPALFRNIELAEQKFNQLRSSEEAARIQADEERKAKEAAETRAAAAETTASRATVLLNEEKKRNLFLASIASLDTETILNLHHQVTIYAVDLHQQIENFLVDIATKSSIPRQDVMDVFERLILLNSKIMGISKFATKANFRLESEQIEANIGDYIEQYINGVAKDFLLGPIAVSVSNDQKGTKQPFKPIDISVVVDNLIANAKKAGAGQISFEITHPTKDAVHISVADNGRGFSPLVDDLTRVFEKGYSTTDGSGLGLYHAKFVLGEMNGTIEAQKKQNGRGATFNIRISK